MPDTYDVIIAGAGNAALCAALAAREAGATIIVLEKAPRELRGGNTFFTGAAFRFPYNGLDDIRRLIPDLSDAEAQSVDVGAYPEPQMRADLMRVSEGLADADLVDLLVTQAYDTMLWLGERGMRWMLLYGRQSFAIAPSARREVSKDRAEHATPEYAASSEASPTADPEPVEGKAELLAAAIAEVEQRLTEQLIEWGDAVRNFLMKESLVRRFYGGLIVEAIGGGEGLSDQLFALAEAAGIEIHYEAEATALSVDYTGRVIGVTVGGEEISANAVVLACGGFEANAAMRVQHLGPDWEHAKVRGTAFNTGDGHRMALDIGAAPYGDWGSCHAVAWDLNAPPYCNRRIGDLYQKHSYPFGIVVNANGERFVDEGADFRNYTYAKYGREILNQPHRAAFQIFDAKVEHLLRDEYRIAQVTKGSAETIGDLADKLGIDRGGLERTVSAFNASVQPGEFDPTRLDGKRTEGTEPPKSNWALLLDEPPFTGYAVTCGITFTFGGLRIDREARVLDGEGRAIPGLYAAGELVGGLFWGNYAGGSGLMAGSVFGRIAGRKAAQLALDVR